MIINDQYKFIFTRIPKSGSTFVADALLKHIPGSRKEVFHSDGHVGLYAAQEKYNGYFNMVSIRDPIEHYVSLFLHIARDQFDNQNATQEWAAFYNNEYSFTQWLNRILFLNPREDNWDAPCLNNRGSTTEYVRYMRHIRRDFGWWTYTLIYQTVADWKNFLLSEPLNSYREHSLINAYLRQHNLEADLIDTLQTLGVESKYTNKISSTESRNKSGIDIDKYINAYQGDMDLISAVRTRESLIYQLLEAPCLVS